MAAAVGRQRTLADFLFPAMQKAGLALDRPPRGDGQDEVVWSKLLQEDRARPHERLQIPTSATSGRMALLQTRSEERARSGRPRGDLHSRRAALGSNTIPRVHVRKSGLSVYASPNRFASLCSSSSDEDSSDEPMSSNAREPPAHKSSYRAPVVKDRGQNAAAERARERSGENTGALAGKDKICNADVLPRETRVSVDVRPNGTGVLPREPNGAAERARERSGENTGALAGKNKIRDANVLPREPEVQLEIKPNGAAERARERSGENTGALAGKDKICSADVLPRDGAAMRAREPSLEVGDAGSNSAAEGARERSEGIQIGALANEGVASVRIGEIVVHIQEHAEATDTTVKERVGATSGRGRVPGLGLAGGAPAGRGGGAPASGGGGASGGGAPAGRGAGAPAGGGGGAPAGGPPAGRGGGAPAGGGGGAPAGRGGGGGGAPRLPPVPERLPYARCQGVPADGERCGNDALFYCTSCDSIYCAQDVCGCNATLWQLREPGISASALQLYQPVHFPQSPDIFVGGYREGNVISYYFAHAHDLFANNDMVPVQAFHFDMHFPWISRMRVVPLVMFPRTLLYPIPQFMFPY